MPAVGRFCFMACLSSEETAVKYRPFPGLVGPVICFQYLQHHPVIVLQHRPAMDALIDPAAFLLVWMPVYIPVHTLRLWAGICLLLRHGCCYISSGQYYRLNAPAFRRSDTCRLWPRFRPLQRACGCRDTFTAGAGLASAGP